MAPVTAGSWFAVVVLALMVVVFGSLVQRQRRGRATRKCSPATGALHGQSCHSRSRSGNAGQWLGTLKGLGWPQLVVHVGGLEATIGAFDVLVSGTTMLTEGATMRRERLPNFPLVSGNHDGIRLMGKDGTGEREWLVSPRDTSIDELWAPSYLPLALLLRCSSRQGLETPVPKYRQPQLMLAPLPGRHGCARRRARTTTTRPVPGRLGANASRQCRRLPRSRQRMHTTPGPTRGPHQRFR